MAIFNRAWSEYVAVGCCCTVVVGIMQPLYTSCLSRFPRVNVCIVSVCMGWDEMRARVETASAAAVVALAGLLTLVGGLDLSLDRPLPD